MCHNQITNKKGTCTQGHQAAVPTPRLICCANLCVNTRNSVSQNARHSTVLSRAQGDAAGIASNHRPRRQDKRTITHTLTHKRTGADGTPQLRGKRALPVLPRKKDSISEGDCTRHPAKVDLKEDTAEANSTSMSRAHRVETLNAA